MTPPNRADRADLVKRKLGGIMDALQTVYELVEAHYMNDDFAARGEANELAARVMVDIRILAETQMEAK